MQTMFLQLTVPFERLWRGQQPLPRALWLYFFIGSCVAPLVGGILYVPFAMLDMPTARIVLTLLAWVGYPIFAAVGVWRSANARPFDRWPLAAAGAKLMVVLVLIVLASMLYQRNSKPSQVLWLQQQLFGSSN
jgi:hypothetical protein